MKIYIVKGFGFAERVVALGPEDAIYRLWQSLNRAERTLTYAEFLEQSSAIPET